jgi:hypothetical protein
LGDWLARNLSTCWKLIWSFVNASGCLNSYDRILHSLLYGKR